MMKSPDLTRLKNLRHQFSVSALTALGVVSLAGLSLPDHALALSGTASSAGMTTTPRESSGASGGATLIRTAASSSESSSSQSASASQVSGPSDQGSASTQTASSGSTHRHVQREEGRSSSHRRSSGETATASTRSGGGKSVVESKDNKVVVPLAPTIDRPIFSLSSGFETRYIFHGLDIIAFNSKQGSFFTKPLASEDEIANPGLNSSAIIYENADVAFKGAHLGVGYIRALSPTYPLFQNFRGGEGFQRRFYQEVDVTADYTASIVGGILDGTIGYNSYFFPYRDYKATSYQGEAFLRLAYKQLKYVVPSFTFYRYISNQNDNNIGNLNGNFTEFRIDGAVPIYHNNAFSIDFAPYVAASYNISYLRYNNQDTGGWNDLETGIKLPTHIGKHFSVTPYGNYGLDLSDSDNLPINNFTNRGFGERTRFWGGVTVAYSF